MFFFFKFKQCVINCFHLFFYVFHVFILFQISENDERLPNNICHLCISYLIDWQRLVDTCKLIDVWLRKLFYFPNRTSEGELKSKRPVEKFTEHQLETDNIVVHDFDHDYVSFIFWFDILL